MHAIITSKTARLARFFTGLILTSVLAACGGAASPGLIKDPSDIKKGRSSIPEGDSGVTFITLPFIAAESGVIKYTTFDISAVARSDYMPVSGEFSAIAGNQYAIQVEVLGDTRIEATEHFGVRLTDASDRLIGELIGEIVNDDFPEFGVSNPVAVERNTGITPLVFTISISEEPVDDFTLQVATRNPEVCKVGYASPREMEACAQDYIPLETTLSFRNGESLSQTVTVQVLADTRIEPDEIVELDVSFNGITKTGVGTIRNDDDMSRVFTSLKMLPARFREDANSTTETICVTFQYALRNAEYYDLHYELVALTKSEWDTKSTGIDLADESDFSLSDTAPEHLRFTRSDTESQVSLCGIQINDDTAVENDEVFGIRLTNAEGAYFYTGYVFVVDNDVPQFTLSARLAGELVSTSGEEKTIQVEEPASGSNLYTLTFTSDANIARGIQYFWSFPAGEASKDDFDGSLSAGVLSFSLVKESESHADRYEASIELSVKSDDLVEKTEILYLELKDLFGQTLIGPDGKPQKYTIFVNDSNALTLSYNCKVDGTGPTTFYFNEGDIVSCDISWKETIAPNALPITLTHKLSPCGESVICASDADFDGDFLKGVGIPVDQPAVTSANWTFDVRKDELVEAPETAKIAVLAKSNDPARAINIATSDPVLTFTIQDGNALTLSTSCVKNPPEEGAWAASGSPFTEGDTVECTITTNNVAGNVPDFSVNVVLANECSTSGSGEPAPICADSDDFVSIPDSVTFGKAINGERTASWSAEIKKDSLVEVSEDAVFQLTFPDFKVGRVDQPDSGEYLIASYGFTIKDGDSLTLSYECKVQGTESTTFYFNEGNTVSCDISWNETIAPNALPITLTHKSLPCGEGVICASDADFDGDFLKGVVIANAQPAVKKANWTFGVLSDKLVEAPETAKIAVLAKSNDPAPAINIATSDPVLTFTIQDGNALTLSTACVTTPPEEGAGAASGSPFTEGDTVECTITTNDVAGNVPDFSVNVALANECSTSGSGEPAPICADLDDFKQFGKSVTFGKSSDGNRTSSWLAEIEEDNLVEVTETARFKLSLVEKVVNLSSDNEETIEFTIKDRNMLAVTFINCPSMPGSTGIVSEFKEGDTVTCTAQTNPVADNVPDITLTVAISDCNEVSQTGSSNKDCADSKDFGESLESSVTLVISDNGIRTAHWEAVISQDNLVELKETARFNLSVEGADDLSSVTGKTIEFTIIDGDKLAVELVGCPSMPGSTDPVSEFKEGATVTCEIQTNKVAANVSEIEISVSLSDCNEVIEDGSSVVVCAESADFGDDAQIGFPTSLVLSAETDAQREATWSAILRADNLIEKQEAANFVMTVTAVGVSVDSSSVDNLNFGFNINDGDRLVIRYPPGVVDEGRTVTLTASPAIAESVGPITVSLSLAGCANSGEIACADGDDFIIDFSEPIEFNHASSSYVLNIRDDDDVEHTENADFKVSVSKDFSHYFKQSSVQEPVVGISSFSDEDNATENKEIPMTMTGDELSELSGSFAFDIADNDEFEFSLSRVALEGEEYQLTAVGAYQFHSKAVTYTFGFTPEVMDSKSEESSCYGNSDIHCLIEDENKLSEVDFVGVKVTKSKVFKSDIEQDIEGSGFSIPVRLTKSSPLQTLASWFTVAVDGNAPGIFPPMGINQPMLALNAETQSISVPSVSADLGAIYPAINHIYLNGSGELMVPGEYGEIIHHPDCMIDNLTSLFWMRGSNLCNFKESDPKIDNAQGMRRPTIIELLSLYSDPVNPIFGGLTGEIQSSSACSAGTPASVYWFNPATGDVTCPDAPPAETPELFVIPFKEGSLQ